MASELRVDTLKDASGNNSVATSTVAQGSAKAWAHILSDASLSAGSLNFTDTVDNGTGDHTVNYTNNMSTLNYSATATPRVNSGSGRLIQVAAIGQATVRVQTKEAPDDEEDRDFSVTIHGALA
jgi:hypothetical protein